ncbi:MAG: 2-oxo acid dehydrogenase subunit E2, partial [Acidobacteria bacterium]|nr:2-oxo acid dehydrogenase subunit E2 [Acidobacteriota bacterium]
EPVRKGEMLLEVETDKAVVEVEALGDGILAGITAREGDVIPVGQTIAWLVQAGETPPAPTSAPAQTGRRVDATPAPVAAAAGPVATAAGGPRISPKARRLAKEHGVDLTQIAGSGSGGEILTEDILKAAQGASGARKAPVVEADFQVRPEPPTTIGRLMAERTTQSWTTVPHFFVTRDVDATALNAAREQVHPAIERSHGVKATHTDLIVMAVARALVAHPRMNASWTPEGITVHPDVNVAVAIAVEHAVVSPVIHHADRLSLGDLARRRRELADRARAGRLQPADLGGATFTISNLGMLEVDAFTAIIVPPQAGILAVGAITDRVVAVDGQPRVRPTMTVTLSSDHRVVDGARAAAFLSDVVTRLRTIDPTQSM